MFQHQRKGYNLRTDRNGRPAGLTDVFLSVKAKRARVALLAGKATKWRSNFRNARVEPVLRQRASNDIRPTGLWTCNCISRTVDGRAGQWAYGGVPRGKAQRRLQTTRAKQRPRGTRVQR